MWDVGARAARETLAGHTGAITGLAVSWDGRTLYSASLDGTVLIWDLAGDRRLGRGVALRPFLLEQRLPMGFSRLPMAAQSISPDGTTLAVGNDDGTVTLVDVRTLRRSTVRTGSEAAVLSLGYMPNGRLLVSDSTGSAIWLAPGTGGVEPAPRGIVSAFSPSFSADGRVMELTAGHEVIVVQRLDDGRPTGPARPYYSPFPQRQRRAQPRWARHGGEHGGRDRDRRRGRPCGAGSRCVAPTGRMSP